MEYNYEYYFKDFADNEIFKKLLVDVENVWDIRKNAIEFLKNEIEDKNIKENNGKVLGDVTFIGNYYIGEDTIIYPNVIIEGPCYIGKNVEIKPGAYIRPGCIISDNCVIGFNSEVKNAVLQKGAKISSLAFVGDSILGRKARIGSGVITANRRFDQENIKIKSENGERIDVGTDFFGLILGDNSRIGANSTTFPGTFIGTYSWIFPLTQVKGFIPELRKVSNNNQLYMTQNEKKELGNERIAHK